MGLSQNHIVQPIRLISGEGLIRDEQEAGYHLSMLELIYVWRVSVRNVEQITPAKQHST
jgi:hypothetical protein